MNCQSPLCENKATTYFWNKQFCKRHYKFLTKLFRSWEYQTNRKTKGGIENGNKERTKRHTYNKM